MKIPYLQGMTKSERIYWFGLLSYAVAILFAIPLMLMELPEWIMQLLTMILHIYTGVWIIAGIFCLGVAIMAATIMAGETEFPFKDVEPFVQFGKTRWYQIVGQVTMIILVYMGGFYINGAIMIFGTIGMFLGQAIMRGAMRSLMQRRLSS